VCTKTYGLTHQLRQLVYDIDQAVSQEDAVVRKKLKLIDQVYQRKRQFKTERDRYFLDEDTH
jgi:hypothetical protein